MKCIEKSKNKINFEINIDNYKRNNYNIRKIAIFTYRDYLDVCLSQNIMQVNDNGAEYILKESKEVTINNKHDKIFITILDNKQETVITKTEERKFLVKIIELTLKNKLGDEKSKILEEKIMGGVDENMLAVLDMIESEDKRFIAIGKREGRAQGRAEGRAVGKQEGILDAKIEIIKTMLKKKMPIKLIEEITKMKKEDILKIENKTNSEKIQ